MKPQQEPNKPPKITEEVLAEMKEFCKSLGINLIEVKSTEGKKKTSIHFVRKLPKDKKDVSLQRPSQ